MTDQNLRPNLNIQRKKLAWQIGLFVVVFISLLTSFLLKDAYSLLNKDQFLIWYIFAGCVLASSFIWIITMVVNVYQKFDFIVKDIDKQYQFWARSTISLILGQLVMLVWAYLDIQWQIESKFDPDILYSLQYRGLFFSAYALTIVYSMEKTNEQKAAVSKIEELQDETFQAKYEVLKQQVNPHFLFNSLNILKGMIRTHNEEAEDYLIKLAEVYRYILQSNTKNDVAIIEELAMIESYYFMLRKRFPNAIELSIRLSKNARQSYLPPLTFQLLLENSVKHNVVSKNKILKIEIYDTSEFIHFKNNFQPKHSLETSNNIGLKNLNSRYNYYGNKEIVISKNNEYFEVKLPLLK